MIRQGANVMNITDPGYLSDFVPDVGVLNGPYLIKTPQEYEKLLASDWYKGIDKKLEAAGFKLIMANGFFGQRHLIADKPVRKPEDMAGMTVRVPPNTMWIETFKSMGARPTTVQWAEVYNALQQNVVAGRRGAARLALGLEAAGNAQGDLAHRALHRLRHVAHQRGVLQQAAQGRAAGADGGRPEGGRRDDPADARQPGRLPRQVQGRRRDHRQRRRRAGLPEVDCARLQGVPEVDAGPARDRARAR